MTFKTNKLRDAITFALCAASLSATGLAMAQDQAADQQQSTDNQTATQLDTITVTGTRIQSQTITSSSPVAEIQKEEFQLNGATRAEDLINQYPQLAATFDTFTNNGSLGYPTVDLRGLGAQRTLTLVNGFRLAPGAGESSDISIIPAAIIKRVDLLTGGASAVYGSDAVAGVVNFVLDDEFEGVSLSTGYSAYQHNNDNSYIQGLEKARGFPAPNGDSGFGGASRNVDLVVGSSFADGRGHAVGWATWRKNDPLFQGQRDYSACALGESGLRCGGSPTNATGNFYGYQYDADGEFLGGVGGQRNPNGDGSFVEGYGAPYNFAPVNYYQRPDERYTFGTSIKYEINEHFKPYMDAMFINKRDVVQIAPSGAFFATLTDQDCANPVFGSFCTDLGLDPTVPLNVQIAKRNVEGGNRINSTDNTQWRIVTGVEGALDEAWNYNASFLHAETSNTVKGINDFLTPRIQDAILGCQPGSFGGCVPYNVFSPEGVSVEAAKALGGVSFARTDTELNSLNAYVSGDTGVALPWVDESIALVLGVEWREVKFAFQADTNSEEGNFAGAGGPATPVSGKTNVSEVFLETAVPLVRDAGFLKALDLDGGFRHSDYNLSGGANTYKLGLAANFADVVRVRGGYNRAIRAPSVVNLFNPQSIALFTESDPCAGADPLYTPEQCANTGVPIDRYGTVASNPANQNNQFIGGSAALKPETAETYTLGVVYTPTADLRFNVDYFDIKVTDTISTIGAGIILEFCAKTGDPFLCNKINRRAGTLDIFRGSDPATSGYVENLTSNFGELAFRGVDLGASYRFDLGPGRLTTSINGTYFIEQQVAPLPGVNDAATYDCAGVINSSCNQPKWRHIASARYTLDRYTFNLRWRYFGEMDYEQTSGDDGFADKLLCKPQAGENFDGCRGDGTLDSYNYFDASATAAIGDYTSVTVGVNNIADKEPPLVGASISGAYNGNAVGGYDAAGRFIFGSVTFRF